MGILKVMFARFILSIFLAFALPVQSFAAASMFECKKHQLGGNDQHQAHAAMMEHHAAMAHDHHVSDTGSNKCSSCDACCFTSALVGTSTETTLVSGSVLVPSARFIPVAHIPGSPSEPPRA